MYKLFNNLNNNILCNINVLIFGCPHAPSDIQQFLKMKYCQPQKRIREMCCHMFGHVAWNHL